MGDSNGPGARQQRVHPNDLQWIMDIVRKDRPIDPTHKNPTPSHTQDDNAAPPVNPDKNITLSPTRNHTAKQQRVHPEDLNWIMGMVNKNRSINPQDKNTPLPSAQVHAVRQNSSHSLSGSPRQEQECRGSELQSPGSGRLGSLDGEPMPRTVESSQISPMREGGKVGEEVLNIDEAADLLLTLHGQGNGVESKLNSIRSAFKYK
jgi:hypothetical protein